MQPHGIGVAIVGCGAIGQTHAAVVSGLDTLEIVGLVDPVEAAATALAGQLRSAGHALPRIHVSLDSALADPRVELVVITTPSGVHVKHALAALRAGRHVVVEKPLDVSLDRARTFAAHAHEAAARGLVSSVISQHRFDTSSEIVHDAIRSGKFGTIGTAVASTAWWRSQGYYDSADWRGTWRYDGGGALMNQGVHIVDLLLSLVGRPSEVIGYASLVAHERIDVEDAVVATIRFDSGAVAALHATTAAYPGLSTRLQIMGSRGSAVIEDDELVYLHAASKGEAEVGPMGLTLAQGDRSSDVLRTVEADDGPLGLALPPSPAGWYRLDPSSHQRQYRDVIRAVLSGGTPRVTVQEAFHALALVRSIYLSSTLGRPVLFDDVVAGLHDDVVVDVRRGRG